MAGCECGSEQADKMEKKTLAILLSINGFMFLVELILGWLAQSTGLMADSLDMLADAAVYGLSLYVVGKGALKQAKAAMVSGMLQMILGFGVLLEVVRRLLFGSDPQSLFMISVGCVALVANIICLVLISKHKDGGVHMRASLIFSTNDVLANLGVILSGVLIVVIDSRAPDLIIGTIISLIVMRGGIAIIRESKKEIELL